MPDGDDPFSKSTYGDGDSRDDNDGDDIDSCVSREVREQATPSPPPPSPERNSRAPPAAERDDTGVVGVKELSGLLGDQRAAESGAGEENGCVDDDGAGCEAVHGLGKSSAKDGTLTTIATSEAAPAVTGAVTDQAPGVRCGAAPTGRRQQSSPAVTPSIVPAVISTAKCLEDFGPAKKVNTPLDVAVVARGFPWRAAGTRAEAAAAAAAGAGAKRSPGNPVAAASRAASLASPHFGGSEIGGGGRGGGGTRGVRTRNEAMMVALETGKDTRIGFQTKKRLPSPFLGKARIRRVASL